jgi:hypothetical protein
MGQELRSLAGVFVCGRWCRDGVLPDGCFWQFWPDERHGAGQSATVGAGRDSEAGEDGTVVVVSVMIR